MNEVAVVKYVIHNNNVIINILNNFKLKILLKLDNGMAFDLKLSLI